MRIVQTPRFLKAVKKLHSNQKSTLDAAIHAIAADPTIGERKTGDLADVLVYKFSMVGQLTLLAYTYQDRTMVLTLLTFGAHENFYRDLKR